MPVERLSRDNRQIQVRLSTVRPRDRSQHRPAYRRPNEFYWLWIAATATYGVGDRIDDLLDGD
jgi:hypothetical protein